MDRTKILFLSDANVFGGAERYLLDLVSHLDQARFRPIVGHSPDAPLALVSELDRLRVTTIAIRRINGKQDIAGFREHIQMIKSVSPGIIHLNLSNPLHGQFAMLAAQFAGGSHRVATLHLPPRQTTPTLRGRTLERLTLGRLDALITVCRSSRRLALRHFDVAPHRVHAIHNGVSPVPDAAVHVLRSYSRPLIGCIGRLTKQKGFDILVEAARVVCDIHFDASFVIIGGGPLKAELEARVKELGLGPHIHLLGEIPKARAHLPEFDVVAVPSRYESFPYGVLEAMAAGRPVVAASVDGIPEAIEHGHTGLLVRPECPEELASAILKLISDEALTSRLSEEARKRSRIAFALPDMVRKTEAVYSRALGLSR